MSSPYSRLASKPVLLALQLALCSGCAGAQGEGQPAAEVKTFRNVSPAMERTLRRGDLITVRLFPGGGGSERVAPGEIVVYRFPPDSTKQFVKRVVGGPGDTLAMREGQLYRNGTRVEEPYAWHEEPTVDYAVKELRWQDTVRAPRAEGRDSSTRRPSRNNWGPLVVPEGHYFVLGDNRDHSLDSRYWGFVPARFVLGRLDTAK